MKYTNKAKLNEVILDSLGIGWSYEYLLDQMGLTHEEMCMHLSDYPATEIQLKKWYDDKDFTIPTEKQDKQLETKEKTPKRTRKPKEDISEELVKVSED